MPLFQLVNPLGMLLYCDYLTCILSLFMLVIIPFNIMSFSCLFLTIGALLIALACVFLLYSFYFLNLFIVFIIVFFPLSFFLY